MSVWQSILGRIGRQMVERDLAGYRAKVEPIPAGLKVVFPDGTIWLVRVTVSALGDPPWPLEMEQQELAQAAEELGGTPVIARVWLTRSRPYRGVRVRYYDLRASRETHPGLFLSPGGEP